MKLINISASVLFVLTPISGAFAAAMDRSGQSIGAFLQPGNYFEAGISVLDPKVGGVTVDGNKVTDMANYYYFPSAALKLQVNESFSFGLLYDQPFGASADYTDGGKYTGTNVKVNTNSLSALIGFQPNENLNFYGGAVYQDVRGNITLSSVATGYNASFEKDDGFGWLAGFAYQIPEIALKLSMTYRSEIDHELKTTETAPNLTSTIAYLTSIGANSPLGPGGIPAYTQYLQALGANSVMNNGQASKDTKISTPQSVNLDFQTGIMENTVAFANVRWVEWGGLAIDIDKFGQLTQLAGQRENIIEYNKDQWSANLGVGRKLNEQWSGAFSVGWDSGAGNPVTALGPTEGYWNVGLNAQFSPTPSTFIGGGVKYFWLGDADGKSAGQPVGKFTDNDALAYGLKMGYRF